MPAYRSQKSSFKPVESDQFQIGPRTLTAQWAGNSEATIRKHYRRLLKQADGKAWFGLESAVDWEPKDQSA